MWQLSPVRAIDEAGRSRSRREARVAGRSLPAHSDPALPGLTHASLPDLEVKATGHESVYDEYVVN